MSELNIHAGTNTQSTSSFEKKQVLDAYIRKPQIQIIIVRLFGFSLVESVATLLPFYFSFRGISTGDIASSSTIASYSSLQINRVMNAVK